jgi:hypothetical protein
VAVIGCSAVTDQSLPKSRSPVWIDPGGDLNSAAASMAEAGISSSLVESPGELRSILTERDVPGLWAKG